MEKLHTENIVHRDIKPGNIMRFIGEDGRLIELSIVAMQLLVYDSEALLTFRFMHLNVVRPRIWLARNQEMMTIIIMRTC